jgi:hypothetical protein
MGVPFADVKRDFKAKERTAFSAQISVNHPLRSSTSTLFVWITILPRRHSLRFCGSKRRRTLTHDFQYGISILRAVVVNLLAKMRNECARG